MKVQVSLQVDALKKSIIKQLPIAWGVIHPRDGEKSIGWLKGEALHSDYGRATFVLVETVDGGLYLAEPVSYLFKGTDDVTVKTWIGDKLHHLIVA